MIFFTTPVYSDKPYPRFSISCLTVLLTVSSPSVEVVVVEVAALDICFFKINKTLLDQVFNQVLVLHTNYKFL